jgi:RNA polymerase sigma-70 factor (ECF subfamily)
MSARSRASAGLTAEDRTLVDALVAELGPRLLAYVRRVYANAQDAEDIVAETFCRAASNAAALRASGRRDLYLLTIARNLCRDGYRRQRPRAIADERLRGEPDRAAGPAAAAEEDERRRALRAAVEALPEHLREIVVLRLSGELRFEDIAELLQIPLGTALSRMHAAVERLREMLGCLHGH